MPTHHAHAGLAHRPRREKVRLADFHVHDAAALRFERPGTRQQLHDVKRRDAGEADKTVLSGVPRAMPSLLRAYELSSRAAQVGFDWVRTADVIDKVEEEIRELRDAVTTSGAHSEHAEEEFGDLLFSIVNVARKLGIEPEAALRVANDKFHARFDDVERQGKADRHALRDRNLEQLEEYWQKAKAATKHTK